MMMFGFETGYLQIAYTALNVTYLGANALKCGFNFGHQRSPFNHYCFFTVHGQQTWFLGGIGIIII